ncbi:Sperm surface protein Sp17 [Orchesella cincta]|uniref:Sperm surface protein Sp17 n=1 Tax=Orchesella cincta TaxID=48709 RepID=A0A1D2MPZ7_ORCCI|nr:Sperm surface protein Sp17 [Orchesella cincta]
MASRTLPEMPCGPILELYGQRKRFHVPYGLKGLIEDMTREVLRHQPNNIYDFLATFMDERLQRKRQAQEENKKRKSWAQHRWSWQGTSNLTPDELNEFMDTLQAPPEAAEHSALVIQSAFRGYQARKQVEKLRKTVHEDGENRNSITEGEDQIKDQQPKRKSVQYAEPGESKQGEESENKEDNLGEARKSLRLSMDNATDAEQHAAVKIQAAFRGHMTRKLVKETKEDHEHEHEGHEGRKSIMFASDEHKDEGEHPPGEESASVPTETQQTQESEAEGSGAYRKSETLMRQSERDANAKRQSEVQKRQSEVQKRQSEIQARLSMASQKHPSGSQPALNTEPETEPIAERTSGSLSKRVSGAQRKSDVKAGDPNTESVPEEQEPAA